MDNIVDMAKVKTCDTCDRPIGNLEGQQCPRCKRSGAKRPEANTGEGNDQNK